ncbi:aminoglycoside phosphotransferase [Reyranella soli]|uniref:Aminoglycoside phosphotransferase n=1 Tax=Reyranella soli TaxID=1230389 RepID=A0A512NG97_9HYPH|nr:aminoglycoside phosphotransferase [Reyranella soli]
MGDGRVVSVEAEAPRDQLVSRIVRLQLTYEGAADAAPRSLILKIALPGRASDGPFVQGEREVAFYAKAALATPAGLVPRCFDSAWEPESRQWHLLLEDLTDTHEIATQWPLPPDEALCRRMVQTLARFHAAWWDHPWLGREIGTRVDAETVRQTMQQYAGAYERFADHLGDRLSRERRQLYDRFFASAHRVQARVLTWRNVTLVHGDAHVWNCFVPKDGSDDLRYFDWDTWRIGLGTGDLAYMIATHWYPERRRQFERPLLDHYHRALLAHGVQDYDRAALAEDYRRSVLMQLLLPPLQWSVGIPPWVWWHHIERITAAVDDLDCRPLLG